MTSPRSTGSTASSATAGTPAPRARHRIDRVVRLIGAPALALYLFSGAISGLRQQSLELPASEIDCEYCSSLLEDRLVAIRSYRASSPLDSTHLHSLNSLLEQTLAVCAPPNSKLTSRLRGLQESLQRWEKAQRELRDAPQASSSP